MRKLAFGSIALLALTARAAMASDLPPPAPAPVYRPPVVAPVFSWSGCYAGGNVGGGWANTHAYDTNGVLTGAAGAPVLNGDLGSQTASGVIVAARSVAITRSTNWSLAFKGCLMVPA